jgi:hypothetical protein
MPEKNDELTPRTRYIRSILVSKPLMKMMPAKEIKKNSHWIFATFSLTNDIPRMEAKTGDRNSMVVVVANGIS